MNMHEYLLDAESQMDPDKADATEVPYTVNGVHCVPVAAGAGDTNICGAIVQLYWNSILERSLDVNGQVRQTALKVVALSYLVPIFIKSTALSSCSLCTV